MQELVIKKDESIQKIETELDEILLTAGDIVVEDQATMSQAGNIIVMAKTLSKKLDERRKEITAPFREDIDLFNKSIKEVVSKATQIDALVAPKFDAYMAMLKKAEEDRLREEAKKKAADVLEVAQEAESHIMEIAEDNDVADLVEQAIDQVDNAKKAIVHVAEKKIEAKVIGRVETGSISYKDKWEAEVVNKLELLRYIVNISDMGHDITSIVDVKQGKINELAKSQGIEQTKNGLRCTNNKTRIVRKG